VIISVSILAEFCLGVGALQMLSRIFSFIMTMSEGEVLKVNRPS